MRSAVDIPFMRLYLTDWLLNRAVDLADVAGSPQHPLLGPRRSHAARDPGAPHFGPGFRHRAGRAFRNEPSRGLQASQGARARRSHYTRPRRAVAALPAQSRSAQGCRRLARALPPFLGTELRSLWGLSGRIARTGEEGWT